MRKLTALGAAMIIAIMLCLGLLAPGTAGAQMMESKTGDLNQDGTANSVDALLVLFYSAELSEPAPEDERRWVAAADDDCDLIVTSLDATLILQSDAGMYELRP
ncbi:MAG: hypothetical protein WD939_01300 [Dehalococcoidia bacterium]